MIRAVAGRGLPRRPFGCVVKVPRVWAVVVAAAAAGGAVGSAVVAYLSLRWQKAVARQGVADGQTARAQTSYLSGMDRLASPDPQARRVGAAELEFHSRDRTAGPYALRARAALDTGLAGFLTNVDPDLDGQGSEDGDSSGGQPSRPR